MTDVNSTAAAVPAVIRLSDYAPPDYSVDTIDLTFDLREEGTRVTARSAIRARMPGSGAPLRLDGVGLELESIRVDGRALSAHEYVRDDTGLLLPEPPASFVLEVVTVIHPARNTALEGLYLSGGSFCTQCEAQGFRKITYSIDRPDVMARYSTTLVADRVRYPVLLSNGNRAGAGEAGSGRHWARWEDPWPKPSYLFALVAGDLVCARDRFVTRSGREVGLEVWVEPHNLDKCGHALASMQRAMRWDEEAFGREYDLDAYIIFSADDFNMGAMENKGLNIFNSKYVLARPDTATDADYEAIEAVIAHEYFHNWTGNRVTCRDWFQLSLKEGLTVFRDQQFTADMTSAAVKRIHDVRTLRSHQFPEDAGPLAHPVRPDAYIEISNFYTATVYEKGAEVIRMMHTLLGPRAFRAGMDLYFARHDGQAVTCDDFAQAMQDASGVALSRFRRWYAQAGTPQLRASGCWDASAGEYRLTLEQHTAPTPGQPEKQPLQIPVRVALIDRASGRAQPLVIDGQPAGGSETVLSLLDARASWTFSGLAAEPVPSLLRGFSAPVRLMGDVSDEDLAFLMGHDDDPFNRWEAGQRLAVRVVLGGVEALRVGREVEVPEAFIHAFGLTLDAPGLDGRYRALALSLPDFVYLGEQMAEIDVERLHASREAVVRALARRHRAAFASTWSALVPDGPYRNDGASIARRALRNACLAYLCRSGEPDARAPAYEQYRAADNMTDQIAALACIAEGEEDDARAAALEAFYRQWSREPLVMDKWFALQARSESSGALAHVRALMAHPAYDPRNPNRIRALVGTFCHGNPLRFHAPDGSGYAFLRDEVLRLDRQNPQIAARLLAALNRWRKHDAARQALMRGALRAIADQPGLSRDVYEVATRALG